MNKNYAIFNESGILTNSSFTPISKGNNKVDELYVYFQTFTYDDGYVTIASTLPNGTSLPELSASNSTFTFNSVTYNGYKLTILDPLTSIAGTLTLTIRLKSNTDDSVLCSSQLSITIHDSDASASSTITDAQYDTLVETISDNYNTLNTNKLNKQFNTYDLASSIDANNDKVILNQSNTPKYAKLDDIYNIKTVNGVSPVSRNISLDAGDIPYSEGSVEDELGELATNVESRAYKYQLDGKVGFRDGTLSTTLPSTSDFHGLLPYDYVKISDNKAEITLDGYSFQLGDIFYLDASDINGARIINGGFVKVIDNLANAGNTYMCLFAYGQSLSYNQLTFELLNDKITIEFSSNQVFANQPRICIVRP